MARRRPLVEAKTPTTEQGQPPGQALRSTWDQQKNLRTTVPINVRRSVTSKAVDRQAASSQSPLPRSHGSPERGLAGASGHGPWSLKPYKLLETIQLAVTPTSALDRWPARLGVCNEDHQRIGKVTGTRAGDSTRIGEVKPAWVAPGGRNPKVGQSLPRTSR